MLVPKSDAPSVATIAAVFCRISSTSFGGGQTAAIRREVVRRREWLTAEEFLELLSVAQILPGANPVNIAILIGGRLRGVKGAVAALFAEIVPAFVILMVLAAIVAHTRTPSLEGALRGCAAVAVGLTLANAIEMTAPLRTAFADVAIVAAVAVCVMVLHFSLALTLAIFVPVALIVQALVP
jgi:chromate transporter